ncbi:MAG: radical SAM protein [Candidatus Omnitrophica bacterium]|nr:radical SAM protein [Candidatus Omnitrophota bacterium]
MKILLINPPSRRPLRAEIPLKIDEEIGAFPSLGLLYIATYLKKRMPSADVEVIDARIEKLDSARISGIVKLKNPDLVGITTLTFSLLDVIDTAKAIKAVNPRIKICLGGAHVSIFPKESLSLKEIDFVVAGEGEETFLELAEALTKKEGSFHRIKGLGFKDAQGGSVLNELRQLTQDLDALPVPDRRLINYRKCYSLLGKSEFMATLQTTRGCPFRCIYCDQQSGKALRKRSVESVMREIQELYALGIRDIFFIDDLFTLDKKRVIELCQRIIDKKISIFFKISARVDTVDKEMLKALKAAGCYRIHYGVESGTQRIINRLQKGITLEQAKDAFSWTKEAGIDTFAYFMIGSPGETREDILNSIDFAIKLDADYAHFSICTPYPDTRLYNIAMDEGVVENDYWREFASSPGDDFATRFWTKELSSGELVSLQNYANKRFYLRPSFFVKELSRTRSLVAFKRKVKAALHILNP